MIDWTPATSPNRQLYRAFAGPTPLPGCEITEVSQFHDRPLPINGLDHGPESATPDHTQVLTLGKTRYLTAKSTRTSHSAAMLGVQCWPENAVGH